jgi:ABC-type glycerol-3-phosphate transport system permease component
VGTAAPVTPAAPWCDVTRHRELIVTASVITTVPMIVVFFLGLRHFMEGVATIGSKG